MLYRKLKLGIEKEKTKTKEKITNKEIHKNIPSYYDIC